MQRANERAILFAIAGICLIGCTKRAIVVSRTELRAAGPTLRAEGRAIVVDEHGKRRGLDVSAPIDAEFPGRRHLFGLLEEGSRVQVLSVGELTDGCNGDGEDGPCVLDETQNRTFTIGEEEVTDWRKVQKGFAYGFTSATLTGLFAYCLETCERPGTTALGAAAIVSYVMLLKGMSAFTF